MTDTPQTHYRNVYVYDDDSFIGPEHDDREGADLVLRIDVSKKPYKFRYRLNIAPKTEAA